MTLAQFPELQKLTDRQKAALADELWMDAMSDKTPVPAAHKKILDARWKDYKSGKTKRINRTELKHWLAKK